MRTAQDILASESLFRLGTARLVVVVILDVVAAALFILFAHANRMIALMETLAMGTKGAQQPEIETMRGWLTA